MSEAKLLRDVEDLRVEYPQPKDLYRAICHLMFFRYGMQPSANKLYQLVRKGTLSLPTQAVNNFWAELRSRNQIDLEHTGLPDNLKAFAGEALGTLWKSALDVARQHYKESQASMSGLDASHKLALESYKVQLKKAEAMNAELQLSHAGLKTQVQEYEKRALIEQQAANTQRDSLKVLQSEKSALEAEFKAMQQTFNLEFNKLNAAIKLAEDKFRKLEFKSSAEIEREQQRSLLLEMEIAELKKTLLKEHSIIKTQNAKNQKLVNELRENIGLIKGQLKESQRQQLIASNKLKQIDRKKVLIK